MAGDSGGRSPGGRRRRGRELTILNTQIAPGLSVSCVTHAGRICGRSLNGGHLEEDLGVYLEAARLQEAAPARSPPSLGPRRADVVRSSQRHALPRRHSEVGADIDFRQPRIWTE